MAQSIGKILCDNIAQPVHAEVQAQINKSTANLELDCLKEPIIKWNTEKFGELMMVLDVAAKIIDELIGQ